MPVRKTAKRKPATKRSGGIAGYQRFIKTKTSRENAAVKKAEAALKAAKKKKAAATKKAAVAYRKRK